MRTIDADALMQTLGITDMDCEKCVWRSRAYRYGQCRRGNDFEDACLAIKDAPTIEPQRMRGKWETIEGWDGDELYRCSECGEEYVLIDGTPKENGYHFCPNCGCQMNGDEEDEK